MFFIYIKEFILLFILTNSPNSSSFDISSFNSSISSSSRVSFCKLHSPSSLHSHSSLLISLFWECFICFSNPVEVNFSPILMGLLYYVLIN